MTSKPKPMRIAFLVLAHEHLPLVARLLGRLVEDGDLAVLHWDANSRENARVYLEREMPPEQFQRVRFAARHRIAWGKWSMVEATFSCLDEVKRADQPVDYAVLVSGADYPLKSIAEFKRFLADSGKELIECVPTSKQWVTRGIQEERYRYRHWLSWRTSPRWFSRLLQIQKTFGFARELPAGLDAHFGSQWWALTWETAARALSFGRRRGIARFFRRVWVPDELFFQSFAATNVPRDRIAGRGPTYYQFSSAGSAQTFYNDHAELLVSQPFFFARKISPFAGRLRDALDRHAAHSRNEAAPLPHLAGQPQDFAALRDEHAQGLANRRVVGSVEDEWYGDLEWNLLPYFVLLAPPHVNVEPLREVLNARPELCCYGELFASSAIGYDLAGAEHPCYSGDATILRDWAPTNFLCDLVHYRAGKFVGFILRTDASVRMHDVMGWDRNAHLVVCPPATPIAPSQNAANDRHWKTLLEVRTAAARTGGIPLVWQGDAGADADAVADALVAAGREFGALASSSRAPAHARADDRGLSLVGKQRRVLRPDR